MERLNSSWVQGPGCAICNEQGLRKITQAEKDSCMLSNVCVVCFAEGFSLRSIDIAV